MQENVRKRELISVAFLTLAGGFQDAYSYICRGGVFVNAQTGNVVLLSACILQRNWQSVLLYLLPLAAFTVGIWCSELIHIRWNSASLQWKKLILLCEIALLFCGGLLPASMSSVANAMLSCACAMQVQSFRRIGKSGYASTMCIGNLRSAVESACRYTVTKDASMRLRMFRYFGLLGLFGIGAALGALISFLAGVRAIWAGCLLLLVGLVQTPDGIRDK